MANRFGAGLGAFLLIAGFAADAADWEVGLGLTMEEVYSDNIFLDADGEARDDFVTAVNPTLTLFRQSARLKLDFDYTMQNLFYADRSSANQTNHRLASVAQVELIDDRLLVDASVDVFQTLVDAEDTLSPDNINITGNRTDVVTYELSPVWQQRFGGYAEMLLRYSYDAVRYDSGEISDANNNTVDLRLNGGPRFGALGWRVNYLGQQLDRDSGEDTSRTRLVGDLQYRLSDDWTGLLQAGYESQDYSSFSEEDDGSFMAVGAFWQPSRRISIGVAAGLNARRVGIFLNPTLRTSFELTYDDLDVGPTTGGVVTGQLSHRTRYSTWLVRYTEGVSSSQQVSLLGFPGGGGTASPGISPIVTPGLPTDDVQEPDIEDDEVEVLPDIDEPLSLTDVDFLRKRFDLSVTYRRGRSVFSGSAYSERRDFDSRGSEQAYGLSAGWDRSLGARTHSFMSGSWQHAEPSDGRESDYRLLKLGLRRRFSQHANGTVEYQYLRRDTSGVQGDDNDYQENRLTLRITVGF